MSDGVWFVVGLLAAVLAAASISLLLVRRHRRRQADTSNPAMAAARRAIQDSARAQRRKRPDRIRGKGYGGNDGQATDAALGSDSGGAP